MHALADALDLPTDALATAATFDLTRAAAVVVGYAAVFFDPADPGTVGVGEDGAEVRIMPGAFDLAASRGVRALYMHDDRRGLGSIAGGTLRLWVDSRGLRFALAVPPTEFGRKALRAVRSGRLTGASFRGRYTRTVDRPGNNGRPCVEVHAVRLEEVSLVRFPRFAGCGVTVASGNPAADDVAIVVAAWANEIRADESAH